MADDSLVMSLATSTGVCFAQYEGAGPIAQANAIKVDRGDGEIVTMASYFEPSEHLKAFAWAPRFTGSISIVASSVILWVILRDRSKLAKTRYRFLFAMSVVDIFNSFALALSSAPTPAGTFGSYGAIGTRATCTVQGFFVQLGFAEPIYSCMLSLYFMLVIHFRYRENHIRRRVEPFMHAVAVLYPLGAAIAGLVLGVFNSSGTLCWIEAYPIGCTTDSPLTESCDCLRGENFFIYQLAFGGVPLFGSFLVTLVAMGLIMLTVWRIERRARRLNLGGPPSARDAHQVKAAAMATQAFLYIWAYLVTYVIPIIVSLGYEFGWPLPGLFHFMLYLLMPLQGFWNFVAFIHPRWKFARSTNPRASKWTVFRLALCDERGRRRGRHSAGVVSAFNGDFQRRQFQIGTISMRSWESRDTFDDDYNFESDSDFAESQQRQNGETFTYASTHQPRQRVVSSTYSSYYDNTVSYVDSDCAVDLGRSSASRVQDPDSKLAHSMAGLGDLGSVDILQSTATSTSKEDSSTAACTSKDDSSAAARTSKEDSSVPARTSKEDSSAAARTSKEDSSTAACTSEENSTTTVSNPGNTNSQVSEWYSSSLQDNFT